VKAIVTEAELPSAVAGLRGLGRAAIPVVAVARGRLAAGRWSRHAAESATSPDPLDDPSGFARRVAKLSRAHGRAAVYPSSEAAIEAMLAGWDELEGAAVLPYPGPEPLRTIRDKRELSKLAAAVGLGAPKTLASGTAEELASLRLPAPCVVKPAWPSGTPRGAVAIDGDGDLERAVAAGRLPREASLLAQERVDGQLMSVELVVSRDGDMVARFQARAERTSPSRAGLISLARSVPPDDELAERLAAMLAQAGYWGLAQVDVIDASAGPTLIDVNPRFYSCLPLSLACGLNLPAIWHAATVDDTRASARPNYETGVVYRWLEGEMVEALRGDWRRLATRSTGRRVGAMWTHEDARASALLAAGAVGSRAHSRIRRRRARTPHRDQPDF
jgi:predicted ATP-grasp superfamily ATP-dependent carboligase